MNMAFTSTRICFMVFLLSAIQITFLSTVTVGEKYVSSWSPWSKCSKDCDGIQIRTRKCIDLSAKCEEALEEERDCSNTTWSTGCFSLEMIIALAVIGAAILVAGIISIILCRRNIKERKKLRRVEEKTAKSMADAIERRYDGSISHGINSRRHFPSASSFPEPLKEPEEMELDNFAFDQESLNESIHEMAFTFGTDEEYQPGKAQKEEEKPMSLKVVSVTETQAIDRDSDLEVKKDPLPIYAVVMKLKEDKEVEDVTV